MAYRRKTTRRKTTPVRRRRVTRRRGLSANFKSQIKPVAMSAVGGALAGLVEGQLQKVLPMGTPAGAGALIGAVVTGMYAPAKFKDVALGMAGVAGAQLGSSLAPGVFRGVGASYMGADYISPSSAKAILNSGQGLYEDYSVTPLMESYYTQGW
jgi:hypothetical protein